MQATDNIHEEKSQWRTIIAIYPNEINSLEGVATVQHPLLTPPSISSHH